MTGRLEIHRLRSRLDETFKRAPDSSCDLELQADFAKYLCVLVSGYLESTVCVLLLSYVKQRCAPDVASYVQRQLEYWTNPKSEKIIELFGFFNKDWRDNLNNFIVDHRKDSINSLVALRHKIAHGDSVSLSLTQIRSYYVISNEVIDYLSNMVDLPHQPGY